MNNKSQLFMAGWSLAFCVATLSFAEDQMTGTAQPTESPTPQRSGGMTRQRPRTRHPLHRGGVNSNTHSIQGSGNPGGTAGSANQGPGTTGTSSPGPDNTGTSGMGGSVGGGSGSMPSGGSP